jgi:hypothetical protein
MVSYAQQHLLLRVLGSFGQNADTQSEIWSCGMRITTGPGTLAEVDKLTFLEAVAPALDAFHQSANNGAHNSSWVQEYTAAYIGTDGKYLGGLSQETTRVFSPTRPGGFQNVQMPWEVARAYTLRTGSSRGRGHVGRFYWPNAQPIQTDGLWPNSVVNSAALTARTLLNAINTAASGIWTGFGQIVVASPLGAPFQLVNRVEVGNVPDTQRRRNAGLLETYGGEDLETAASVRSSMRARTYTQ